MLRKIRAGLSAGLSVASRAIRPQSLYCNRSTTDTHSTDSSDSIYSEPSDIYANIDYDIYSHVTFDPVLYDDVVPRPLRREAEAEYDVVEYFSSYDIYEKYGFDNIYELFHFHNSQVYTCGDYLLPNVQAIL